jgi:hypothetical protein
MTSAARCEASSGLATTMMFGSLIGGDGSSDESRRGA